MGKITLEKERYSSKEKGPLTFPPGSLLLVIEHL
jgi:hypothetical protein